MKQKGWKTAKIMTPPSSSLSDSDMDISEVSSSNSGQSGGELDSGQAPYGRSPSPPMVEEMVMIMMVVLPTTPTSPIVHPRVATLHQLMR